MSSDTLAGRTIAGYRLLERIGEGGTAEVYRAEHPERGTCAFKVLRPRLRGDPTAVKRFLREAGYGARVRHPGVVRTYDYGEADGMYYLALEWAEGKSLADYVHRAGPLAGSLEAEHVGTDGYHVVAPLPRHATFDDSGALADRVARLLVDRRPRELTLAFAKADRDGRIYVDTGRNRPGATFAAPYTVRARPGAPVSAPCTWDEVASGAVGPRTFTLGTMAARLAQAGDLWAGLVARNDRATGEADA